MNAKPAFACCVLVLAMGWPRFSGCAEGEACVPLESGLKPYYESIDGVGYLLYALLQLDQAMGGSGKVTLELENW